MLVDVGERHMGYFHSINKPNSESMETEILYGVFKVLKNYIEFCWNRIVSD